MTHTTEDNTSQNELVEYAMLFSPEMLLEAGLKPVEGIEFPVVALKFGSMVHILSAHDFVSMAVDVATDIDRVQYAAG